MLEASGGSGPPKARVLWGPIGTDGVNRRAVSPRSVFAHEPRVVFRDNKRATSSSVGNDPPFLSLSPPPLFSLSSPSFLPSFLPSALTFFERVKLPPRNRNCHVHRSSLPPFDSSSVPFVSRNRLALLLSSLKRRKRGGEVAVYRSDRERSANENERAMRGRGID